MKTPSGFDLSFLGTEATEKLIENNILMQEGYSPVLIKYYHTYKSNKLKLDEHDFVMGVIFAAAQCGFWRMIAKVADNHATTPHESFLAAVHHYTIYGELPTTLYMWQQMIWTQSISDVHAVNVEIPAVPQHYICDSDQRTPHKDIIVGILSKDNGTVMLMEFLNLVYGDSRLSRDTQNQFTISLT